VGITTAELDEVGAGVMRRHGARSAPALVYQISWGELHQRQRGGRAWRSGPTAQLEAGDLVKLDVTVEKDGFMADAADDGSSRVK
jgi:methionyl aminopeptidase